MKCPECGSEMEKGVVSSSGWSIAWSKEPIFSLLQGDRLTKNVWAGTLAYIEGHRCPTCKLIIAHYQKE